MTSTKIELEYPYNKDWVNGYLVTNKENRKTVIFYGNKTGDKKRSSTQFARYKLAVSLGRYLNQNETVDHIDNNKTNDDISNLQILPLKDNIVKSQKKPPLMTKCFICGDLFQVKRNLTAEKRNRLLKGELCCSKKCGYKKSKLTLKSKKNITLWSLVQVQLGTPILFIF